jgi:hypothetical protein
VHAQFTVTVRESRYPGRISPADAATVIAAANQIGAVIGCTFSPT